VEGLVSHEEHLERESVPLVVRNRFDIDQRRFKTPNEVLVDNERAEAAKLQELLSRPPF
jgi:hypothetical protein